MTKYEKLMIEDSVKKDTVLKILDILNNESYADARQILEATHYFLNQNSYVDSNLAKSLICSLVTENG